MQHHTTRVRRALYGSLAKLFDRVGAEGTGDSVDFDVTNLKIALFRGDVEIEALRLLRAEAIAAISKASPTMSLKMKGEETQEP